MSAVIMEGAPVRDALSITQKERAERLTALGHTPCLAAVLAELRSGQRSKRFATMS